MNMYYAPVIAKLSDGVVDEATSNSVTTNMIEKAINNAIVIPFQSWVLETWARFVLSSHLICLGIAVIGATVYIVGIDKGKKVAIIAVASYLGIQFINYVIVGG